MGIGEILGLVKLVLSLFGTLYGDLKKKPHEKRREDMAEFDRHLKNKDLKGISEWFGKRL